MDLDGTVERACVAIAEAGANGARLIVFPEVWLTGYPYWTEGWDSDIRLWVEARRRFYDAALRIPGEHTDRIGDALRRADLYCVLGCNEMDPRPGVNTIYNSLVYFSRDGSIMGRHRKLVPTFVERMFWGSGDASDIRVYDTDIGRIGGLICGENAVTAFRAAMVGLGEDIHVASYPGAFAIHSGPRLQEWNNTGDFWGHFVTRAHAFEAGCHVLCACGFLDPNDVPDDFPFRGRMHIDWSRGGSQVVGPLGIPVVAPCEGSRMVYADCAAEPVKVFKAICDTLGHYSRPDAVRVILHGSDGWTPVHAPYVSGLEAVFHDDDLRRAADDHEVDVDRVREAAERLQSERG
jgi:predicted amidohydrolase